MSAKGQITLATNATNTNTNAVTVASGRWAVRVAGTVADVQLQSLGPNSVWLDVDGGDFAAAAQKIVDLCGGQYRLSIDANSSGIYADMVHVGP